MEQKYCKIPEISRRFGIPEKTVRAMCHKRGQRFAFRPVERGNFLINIEAFEKYLKGKCEA